MTSIARWLLLATLALAPPALQDAAPAEDAPSPVQTTFPPEQLDQIALRVALYPDELLAQVLMASTYPSEIIHAARWTEQNPGLQGAELEAALKDKDWDASVKALCALPLVLDLMNRNLDWAQDLGDAYLGQREELFAALQRMRKKAQADGMLQSSDKQTVTQAGDAVVIEPVSDEMVWLPSLTPEEVYGAEATNQDEWFYADWYQPWDDSWLNVSGVWYDWSEPDWDDDDINVDDGKHDDFVDKVEANASEHHLKDKLEGRIEGKDGKLRWQHDVDHRRGVNYRNPAVTEKFAGRVPADGVTRDIARGFTPEPNVPRPGGGTPKRPAPRPEPRPAPVIPAPKPSAPTAPALPKLPAGKPGTSAPRPAGPGGQAGQPAPRPKPARPKPKPRPAPRPAKRPSALNGSRSPKLDRAGSKRGAKSRGGGRPRGGGGRRR